MWIEIKKIKCSALALMAAMLVVPSTFGADAPPTNLQLTMLTKVNPQALALWDITNGALDADGNIAGSKLTVANWTMLLEIGKALEEGGRALSNNKGPTGKVITAATPGAKLQDEKNPGASTAADVQRYIDAEPVVFRSHALELQKTGALVIEAAKKRDAQRLSTVSNALDEVCESCHVKFWYPQQTK